MTHPELTKAELNATREAFDVFLSESRVAKRRGDAIALSETGGSGEASPR